MDTVRFAAKTIFNPEENAFLIKLLQMFKNLIQLASKFYVAITNI